MKKVFWKKLITVLIAAVAVVLMIVAAYGIGFQDKNSDAKINLDDLKKVGGAAKTTYDLMVSGIVLSGLAVVLLLVSLIFGRLLLAFDWIVWGGGVFVLLIGVILVVAGEGYFASKAVGFKNLYDQGMFAAMIVCSLVPGLIGIGLGAASFQKKK